MLDKKFKLSVLVVLCVAVPSLIMAATTGKISGKIIDGDSGEPLPGANITIVGTSLGAATNLDGDYFILNVPPGNYSVKTTMIGFEPVTMLDVNVQVDRTTTINVQLKSTVLLGEEVTVVSQRDIVRKDVSYTQVNLDARALEEIPASYTLDQALTSQAGVGYDSQGLTIRRADNQQISYVVDGLVLKDERTNRPYSGVSKTGVEEVQLLAGTFGAEYGDARVGVVNVVSKEPRTQYTFNFEGQYSPTAKKHFGPYIYSNENWFEYGRFDWNGGNPAADKNKDGSPDFEGWTSWAANNTYQDQTLTPEQAFAVWAWHHRSEDKDGNVLYNEQPIANYQVGNQTLGQLIQPLDQRYAGLQASVDPHPLNYYAYDPDWNYDMTLTGPIPGLGEKLGFVLSHRNENTMFPLYGPQPVYKDKSTQLKLVFRPNPDMKLMVNGLLARIDQQHQGDFTGSLAGARPTRESINDVWDGNDSVYRMDRRMVPRDTKHKTLGATWTHTLSSRTFYEITAQGYWIDYTARPFDRTADISPTVQIGPVQMAEEPRNWRYQGGVGSDMLGIYPFGGGRELDLSDTRTLKLRGDLTSQLNIHHQLKVGFEYTDNRVNEFRGYTEFPFGPDWIEGTADDDQVGDQANWHEYTRTPRMGAIYAQDRMEYLGMVLTLGLRADFYQPHTPFYDNNDIFFPGSAEFWDQHDQYFDPTYTVGYYGLPPDANPPLQKNISPRVGISHPIGTDSKIYFNYGHFYQLPNFSLAYQFQLGVDEPLEDHPNAWLLMPKSINYEVGYEQRIYGDYVINARAYYRDVTRDIVDRGLTNRQNTSGYATNTLARDYKGIELSLEKKYGQFLTGFLNMDWASIRDSEFGWDQHYHPESAQIIRDVNNVQNLRIIQAYTNAILITPGTYGAKLNLALHTPASYGGGPDILGAKPLGLWNVQLLHTWRQGDLFTWNPNSLASLENALNFRYKDFHETNLRVEKMFRFSGVTAAVYGEVWNLFNVKNGHDTDGFASRADNGLGGSTGPNARAYAEALGIDENGGSQSKSWGSEPDDANSYLIQRPYIFWLSPRDVWFGIRFFF